MGRRLHQLRRGERHPGRFHDHDEPVQRHPCRRAVGSSATIRQSEPDPRFRGDDQLLSNGGSWAIGQVNNPQIYIAGSGSATTNGILGGWAIVNGSDFASYTAAQGVGRHGGPGFAGYTGNAGTAGARTDNVNVTATVANVTGRTINSLAIRDPGAMTYVNLNTLADTLTLGTGGLLINDAQTRA